MKFKNIIKLNLQKYNYNKELYNKDLVQLLMDNANTHLIKTYKEFLLYENFSEFLIKYYSIHESPKILIFLYSYYKKASYIFPNYNVIDEGKYIYKNIIKKQILINYIEDLAIQKRYNMIKKNKFDIKNNNDDRIFDTQLYNNINFNNFNNSNINILFGIKLNNKNKDNKNTINIENDSINSLKKIIFAINESHTKSIGINTIDISSYNDYNRKKIKKEKKRNYFSSKGIINNTNYTPSISNSNIGYKFKTYKKINVNKNNFSYNTINGCILGKKKYIDNLTFNKKIKQNRKIKMKKKIGKINIQKRNSYLNSNFMKLFLSKIKEKKLISNKTVLNENKSENNYIKNKAIKVLTPITQKRNKKSIFSLMAKNLKYSVNLSNTANLSKININNTKYKTNQSKNIIFNHYKSKSKYYIEINKRELTNNYFGNQRNKVVNTVYNIKMNNTAKNKVNNSLSNIVYKMKKINKIKKPIISFTQYHENRIKSLCNTLFKNKKKEKSYSNYSSKKTLRSIFKKREKKANNILFIFSHFRTKQPSPVKHKEKLTNAP